MKRPSFTGTIVNAALSILLFVSVATQAANSSYYFTVSNKSSGTILSKEMSEQFNFFYKLSFSNDTIYPYYCHDSLGKECFPKIPYMLKEKDRIITVKYFEEALDDTYGEANTSEMNYELTLFSLNPNDTLKLTEPIDFPIMFFDDNVKTVFSGEDVVVYGDNRLDCYKFKILDFPIKGFSYIYLDRKNLVPIKFEVISFSSKKSATIRDYSTINLYKIE